MHQGKHGHCHSAMSHQISQKGGFPRNPGIAMAFKCQLIGIDPFFHDANGSLDAFCLESLRDISPVIVSHKSTGTTAATFRLQSVVCLALASFAFWQGDF